MKTSIRRFLISLFFVSSILEFSAHAADFSGIYNIVSSAQEALPIIRAKGDQNAILISPVSFDSFGQKMIQIYRGSEDYISQVGAGIENSWTNSMGSEFGNIDFSKKPTNMSFDDFMDECKYLYKSKFFTDSGTYELSIHTKTKEIKLSGDSGFEVRKLSDGSFLLLLGKNPSNAQKSFSVIM